MITCVKCLAESLAPGSRGETPARATAESVKMWSPCSKAEKTFFSSSSFPSFVSIGHGVLHSLFNDGLPQTEDGHRTSWQRAVEVTGGLGRGQ